MLHATEKLSLIQTVKYILRKEGIAAFWRGIGPALVLVINPIVQVSFDSGLVGDHLIIERTSVIVHCV